MATSVDVIIRTTAEAGRRQELLRAIASIQNQEQVDARAVVVVNGDRYDPDLVDHLSSRPDITYSYFRPGSTGRAMWEGRRLVTAPFFAYLDDDDELLLNSVSARLAPMLKDASIDAVISNGYFVASTGETSIDLEGLEYAQKDPLDAIMKALWLAPCGGLFRAETVGSDLFDSQVNYHEWTLFAFKLAVNGRRLRFVDTPLYRRYDTLVSLSKTVAFSKAMVGVLEIMRCYRLPRHVRTRLERKYRNGLHVLAAQLYREGEYFNAWRQHIRSMAPPHTLRFLAFTRKILVPRRKPLPGR